MVRADIATIVAQRLWQAGSGLVTMVLVAHFLTPVQQGWYYSFLSLAAFYTLFDLGLSVVLVQLAAHLFVAIRWRPGGRGQVESRLEGDAATHQFHALTGRSARLYVVLALAFLLLLLPGGWLFFSLHGNVSTLPAGQWLPAWALLIVATAAGILALPFLALVEGSGQIGEVYGVRLAQGVVGAFGCWAVLSTGGGLWAPAMTPAFGVLVAVAWLLLRRPKLIRAAHTYSGHELNWRHEIWPLQWRIGLSWLSGYLLTQIYTPILFHSQGAVVAGQMGLSLTLANMLGLLAQSWIARRVPAMAQAANRRDWPLLDRLFKHDFTASALAFVAGALVLCGLRAVLAYTPYTIRVLPFWPFTGLLMVAFLININGTLAAQLRSFRREPLVWVAVGGAVLSVPGALWAAGHYSADGVVAVMLAVQLLFILPWSVILWRRRNREWRMTF